MTRACDGQADTLQKQQEALADSMDTIRRLSTAQPPRHLPYTNGTPGPTKAPDRDSHESARHADLESDTRRSNDTGRRSAVVLATEGLLSSVEADPPGAETVTEARAFATSTCESSLLFVETTRADLDRPAARAARSRGAQAAHASPRHLPQAELGFPRERDLSMQSYASGDRPGPQLFHSLFPSPKASHKAMPDPTARQVCSSTLARLLALDDKTWPSCADVHLLAGI